MLIEANPFLLIFMTTGLIVVALIAVEKFIHPMLLKKFKKSLYQKKVVVNIIAISCSLLVVCVLFMSNDLTNFIGDYTNLEFDVGDPTF